MRLFLDLSPLNMPKVKGLLAVLPQCTPGGVHQTTACRSVKGISYRADKGGERHATPMCAVATESAMLNLTSYII